MGDAPKPILAVSNLWVTFPAYRQRDGSRSQRYRPAHRCRRVHRPGRRFGAGKTTLARAIMGLVPPPGVIERGQVLFDRARLERARRPGAPRSAGSRACHGDRQSARRAQSGHSGRPADRKHRVLPSWGSAGPRAIGWRLRCCGPCAFPIRSGASAPIRMNSAAAWRSAWPSPSR